MKGEIKNIFSMDIDDLESFRPKIQDSFNISLRIIAAPEGSEGEESFDIQVCTPKWLSENMKEKDVVIGRHFLFVMHYDYGLIVNRIKEYINECDGADWVEIATKISRLGHWEFEDYRE